MIPGLDDPHDTAAILAAMRGESTSRHYMLKRDAEETATWCALVGVLVGALVGIGIGALFWA